MKKLYALLFLLLMTAASLRGQVSVSASAGTANGSYTTLKAAFDAINNGTHQGVISILINAATTETETARLNASEGIARYTSVRILPATACMISGNIRGPLIDLYGADSVIIDGRPGGTGGQRSLTLRNVYSTENNGASTIQLSNGAMFNTLQYLNIEGAASNTIFIGGPGTSQTNSFNTIDNNDIRPAGNNLPAYGIRSSAGDVYQPKNTGNVISNNLIHDFSADDGSAGGIALMDPGSGYRITGNSFYQSVPLTFASGRSYSFLGVYGGSGHHIEHNFIGGSAAKAGGQPAAFSIVDGMAALYIQSGTEGVTTIRENIVTNLSITNTSVSASTEFEGIRATGGSLNITGNTVGSLSGTGAITLNYTNAAPRTEIAGIWCNGSGTATIQNNKVGGITLSGAVDTNAVLKGIKVEYFTEARITDNIIGGPLAGSLQVNAVSASVQGIALVHLTTTSSRFTCARNTIQHLYNNSSGTSIATIDGIYNALPLEWQSSPAVTTIADNQVSHLHNTATNAMTGSVTGIYSKWIEVSNHLSFAFMNDSIIGNQISELSSTSSSPLTEVSGILHDSPRKYLEILSNTIRSLRSASANTDTLSNTAVKGIGVRMSREVTDQMPAKIIGNKIYDLAGTASAATVVSGISAGNRNSQLFTISKNLIYGLNNEKASKGFVAGLLLRGYGNAGIFAVNNNMISLSPDNASVYGLLIKTTIEELRLYYNSIAISGTAAGSNRSAAFYRTAPAITRILSSNNIFYNARQGGSGQHYALINDHTTPSTGWNYSNYNNLYSSNPATVALWGNTPVTFIDFQTSSLRDRCSKNIAPDFSDTGNGGLHLQDTYINHALLGNPVAGITDDIDGEARHTIPSMGADEITLPVAQPVITASGPVTFCEGGQLTLSSSTASGNRWYRNGVLISGATAQHYQVTQTGFYKTIVMDGCITLSSDSIKVTVNPVPDTPVISRSGDTLFSSAAAGNQWFLYDQPISGATAQYFIPAQAGRYTVQVKINDCAATSAPFNYGPVCNLSLSSSVTPVLCYGGATGKVLVTVNGGAAPFTYAWSNGATGKDLDGVAAGDYSLVVTDAQGCKGSLALTVTQPDSLRLRETHNNITCDKFALGSIDLSVSGGTPPYQYQWSNGATTPDLIWLKAGKYTVRVTDANACQKAITVTILPAPADCNQKAITLYPNPATNVINLKISGYNENMLLVVYDIYLRKRIEQRITVSNGSVTSINVQALTAGPYVLLLTTSDGTVSRPFLKL